MTGTAGLHACASEHDPPDTACKAFERGDNGRCLYGASVAVPPSTRSTSVRFDVDTARLAKARPGLARRCLVRRGGARTFQSRKGKAMKTFDVSIKGTTALLQHRFGEAAEGDGQKASRNIMVMRGTPREEAEKVTYKNGKGEFYFPGAAIGRLLREAGGNHKLKGSRKSAKYVVPAAVLVQTDEIIIRNGDGNTPAKDFEVDSRPVTIPATKGRVMRHRPRFDEWSATFPVRVNDTILPTDFVNQLLTEGGQQIGIGDYRPEKGGPFGTFIVTSWKEAKA